jgi:BirA family transcriptional regulator, biotin operon repressor / biotin---[acetyl-CoA-carboxylase] ligase
MVLSNGSRVIYLETCASTMDEARAVARNHAPHLTTVWAETQTAGRGRQGRNWQSQVGAGLYFTAILHLNIPAERLGLLPLLAGAVLCSSVRNQTNVLTALKWPNDLLAPDGRKLAGVLVERDAHSKRLLLGIGLNIQRQRFENPNGAGLEEFCESVKREALLMEILEQLHIESCSLEHGPEHALELWNAMQNTLGQTVKILQADGSSFDGMASSITNTGALRIQTNAGEREVSSGEVSLRLGTKNREASS